MSPVESALGVWAPNKSVFFKEYFQKDSSGNRSNWCWVCYAFLSNTVLQKALKYLTEV